MLINNSKISKIIGFLTIYFVLDFLFCGFLINTHAEQSKNRKKSDNVSYEGLPSNRRDGGSRGNCIANGKDFVALVPDRPVNETALISSQLFFYVPQTEEPKEIEFILRNRQDELVHKTLLQTTKRSGIMSVAIPEQVQENSREYYGDYHWYLSLICDSQQRSKDVVLEGWIEYVELNNAIKEQINLSNSVRKLNLLQQEGIWYDALSVLAEQKEIDSDLTIIQKEWSQLLESIGLSDLASEPLIKAEITKNSYATPPTKE
ncbi:MAG: DUF928 domain-containing protein [Xenococcaceae cyanobacterium MO_188.B29]|nr:DUF928 domain-containing protein [Xenococcaceae cyanobacterium MO_188.B29]